MMSILPQASIAVCTSASGAPSLVRSPPKTAVSPAISPAPSPAPRLLRQVGIEIVDNHLGAVLGQQLRRRAADAAGGPGHDRHFVLKNSHAAGRYRGSTR